MVPWIHTAGLKLLRRAKAYSTNTGRNPWDFSVEVNALVRGGMSITDLRWLIAMGYAEHAAEKTVLSDRNRRFRPLQALIFPPRTCLVLTDAGLRAVSSLVSMPDGVSSIRDLCDDARTALGRDTRAAIASEPPQSAAGQRSAASNPSALAPKKRSRGPNWNADRHELRMGSRSVKRFKRCAPAQELILAAFEEEGWPEMIDDPLPMKPGQDSKTRLHHTVHHLNRGLHPHLIRFHVDGGGQHVCWRSARDPQEIGEKSVRDRREMGKRSVIGASTAAR